MFNIKFDLFRIELLLVLVTLSSIKVGYAAVTTVNNLSFGTIAVLNNASTSQITISPSNQITITNAIRVIQPAQRGEFYLTGFPAHTQLFISTTMPFSETSSSLVPPGSAQFSLTALSTVLSVTTDAAGAATIYVGGTLDTSGNATRYYDVTYSVQFYININY